MKKILLSVLALLIVAGAATTFVAGGSLQGNFPARPDLTIMDIVVENSGDLTVIAKNVGTGYVTQGTAGTTGVYINNTTAVPTWGYVWTTLADQNFFAPGGITPIRSQNLSAGTYEVKACVDDTRVVNERSETNNCLTKTLVVGDSLAISLASSPVSSTQIKGTDDVSFLGLNFACGSYGDCIVTGLTLGAYYDDDTISVDFDDDYEVTDHSLSLSTAVSSLWLEDENGTSVGSAQPINSTSYNTAFTGMSWTIPAGTTETLYVKGDISSSVYSDGDNDGTLDAEQIAFYLSSAANVIVENAAGDAFSATAGGSTIGTVNAATNCVANGCIGAPSVVVETALSGSLTVSVSADTPSARPVAAGSLGVEVSKFDFASTLEAFTVTDLAVNNKQSGVIAANLGDYDNNVSKLVLSYKDSTGATVAEEGYLVEGTALFSGLDLYVPMDGTTTLTIYADLNAIGVATAGEFVNLSLAYNNFEAIGATTGEMLTAADLDASVSNGSDLDIGSTAWTSGSEIFELESPQSVALTLGSTTTLIIDNGSGNDNTNKLPVGTLLCIDDNKDNVCMYEDIYVVTSWPITLAGTTDSVTVLAVDDAGDNRYDDEEPILYALPGTGFHTGTNAMEIY